MEGIGVPIIATILLDLKARGCIADGWAWAHPRKFLPSSVALPFSRPWGCCTPWLLRFETPSPPTTFGSGPSPSAMSVSPTCVSNILAKRWRPACPCRASMQRRPAIPSQRGSRLPVQRPSTKAAALTLHQSKPPRTWACSGRRNDERGKEGSTSSCPRFPCRRPAALPGFPSGGWPGGRGIRGTPWSRWRGPGTCRGARWCSRTVRRAGFRTTPS